MKKLLTSTALVVAILVSGAAHAAPTCHQKVAMSGQDFFQPVYKLKDKVSKMVKPQALDLIASTDADREDKAKAYVDAVASTTAKLLKTTLNDDFNDMSSHVWASVVKDFDNYDKFTQDVVSNNNVKASRIGTAAQTVITGFFACK